jgi:hypothetical protein
MLEFPYTYDILKSACIDILVKKNYIYLTTMSIVKKIKDFAIKVLFGKSATPRGLFELSEYFRLYEPIHFKNMKEGGELVARSTNFRYGSIVTSGKNKDELNKNIKDAILTSFGVPSSYANEAKVINTKEQYALA